MIHPQTFVDYSATLQDKTKLAGATVADLKSNPALFAKIQNWVAVGPNEKVSDAKFAMDSKKGCRDVFVTEN